MNSLEKAQDALNKWHEQEKQLMFLNARCELIRKDYESACKEKNEIEKDKYKYSDIAVREHKYWSNDDGSIIVRIGDINRVGPGIEFFISQKDRKDQKYYSPSITILGHGDNPISQEKFKELYDKM